MLKKVTILSSLVALLISFSSAFADDKECKDVIKVVEAKSGRMLFSGQERPGRWDMKACEAKAQAESIGHGGIETKCVVDKKARCPK